MKRLQLARAGIGLDPFSALSVEPLNETQRDLSHIVPQTLFQCSLC